MKGPVIVSIRVPTFPVGLVEGNRGQHVGRDVAGRPPVSRDDLVVFDAIRSVHERADAPVVAADLSAATVYLLGAIWIEGRNARRDEQARAAQRERDMLRRIVELGAELERARRPRRWWSGLFGGRRA